HPPATTRARGVTADADAVLGRAAGILGELEAPIRRELGADPIPPEAGLRCWTRSGRSTGR
ncbi:MAG: hypothetical protein J2P30_14215, partial [Actinobacteria bacterium]|nr:hypothetical protein [Actinomycetota bacterium]